MRLQEAREIAGALEWGEVDEAGSRFPIKQGKTATAWRWVAVPEWLMAKITNTCLREDHTPERRVFAGFTDLRHRYASVRIGRGCW